MQRLYRKRVEYVYAEQFDPDHPPDYVEVGKDGFCRYGTGGGIPHVIRPGQWILTDDRGVRTHVKPELFADAYEAVED